MFVYLALEGEQDVLYLAACMLPWIGSLGPNQYISCVLGIGVWERFG